MKRIKVSMHVTLDGFVAGLKGEMDWIKFDDKMFDFVKTFTPEQWQAHQHIYSTSPRRPSRASRHTPALSSLLMAIRATNRPLMARSWYAVTAGNMRRW